MTSHAPRAWWLETASYAPIECPTTRGVPRVPPSRLAAPLHSDFLRGGDLKKGMGGKGEGRLPFRKKEVA